MVKKKIIDPANFWKGVAKVPQGVNAEYYEHEYHTKPQVNKRKSQQQNGF